MCYKNVMMDFIKKDFSVIEALRWSLQSSGPFVVTYPSDHWENVVCRNANPKTRLRLKMEISQSLKWEIFFLIWIFFYFDHLKTEIAYCSSHFGQTYTLQCSIINRMSPKYLFSLHNPWVKTKRKKRILPVFVVLCSWFFLMQIFKIFPTSDYKRWKFPHYFYTLIECVILRF